MKTAEEWFKREYSTKNITEITLNGAVIIKDMIEYAKEAIKADRINLLEYIQLSFVPHDEESWEEKEITRESILEFYNSEEEEEDWAYIKLKERNGFTIEIDKDSIINAPSIELK